MVWLGAGAGVDVGSRWDVGLWVMSIECPLSGNIAWTGSTGRVEGGERQAYRSYRAVNGVGRRYRNVADVGGGLLSS